MFCCWCISSHLGLSSKQPQTKISLLVPSDDLLLSSICNEFQMVIVVKQSTLHASSKWKSGAHSSSMVNYVVGRDSLHYRSDRHSGWPAVSTWCVTVTILNCMCCAAGSQLSETGSQWSDFKSGSGDELLGAINVIQARMFWSLFNFCKFYEEMLYTWYKSLIYQV